MKYAKYAAVVLLVLAVIGAVLQLQRESIVRKLANAALSEQGITATELSVETLGTDRILLSKMVLEHADGTRYVIGGLSIPVSFSASRPESISIDQVEIVSAEGSDRPAPFSRWLRTVLQLPDDLPDTTVTISRLVIADRPVIENIHWISTTRKQQLRFEILAIEFDVDVDRIDADRHEVAINAAISNNPDPMSAVLTVSRNDGGFGVNGKSTLELAAWVPLLQSSNWISPDWSSASGGLEADFQFELYDDEARATPFSAAISLLGEITAAYSVNDQPDLQIQVGASEAMTVAMEYPSLTWTATAGRIAIATGVGPLDEVTIGLGNLKCESGIICTVHSNVSAGDFNLDTVHIGKATWSAFTTVTLGNTFEAEFAPGFELMLDDISNADFSADSVMASAEFPLKFQVNENGWHGDIESMNLAINNLVSEDNLQTSFLLSFDQLRVRDAGATIDTDLYIPSETASLSLQGLDIVMPSVDGRLSLKQGILTSEVRLSNTNDSLSIGVKATHNFQSGQGSLSTENAALDFEQGSLSTQVMYWPFTWDLTSGQANVSLELSWTRSDDELRYNGEFQTRLTNAAGNYEDIAFSGLNNELDGRLDSAAGTTLSQSTVSLELLEIGLPVRQIESDFRVDLAEKAVYVNAFSMSALGGSLLIDPFEFHSGREMNALVLRPQSIQLRFMTELAKFDDIELSGSISGVLPMTISEKILTIEGGRLESDPPGGAIRYLPGAIGDTDNKPTSSLDLVTRALGNFQFDSLTSDVDYSANGDLKLKMKLTGINPDLDDLQPVILNLSIENNIPQLLRSLQATRSIEDILQR